MIIEETFECPLSGVLMRGHVCDFKKCWKCGWNPEVHRQRVRILRTEGPYALTDWWKDRNRE